MKISYGKKSRDFHAHKGRIEPEKVGEEED
jgi:hypothetical protein